MALDSSGSEPRHSLATTLELVATYGGGSVEDTALIDPYRMAADRDRFFLLEPDQRVLCFDTTGHLLWTQGKEGGGPGEYRNVRDMKVGVDGRLWLLDPSSARATILNRSGKVAQMLRLAGMPHSETLVTLPDGRFAVFPRFSEGEVAYFTPAGQPAGLDTLRWAGFRELDPMARGFLTATDPARGQWAVGFIWGNGWFAADSGGRWLSGRRYYVEPTRFAPVVKEYYPNGDIETKIIRTPAAALDFVLRDDTLYVLFDGQDPERRKKLDLYALGTGNYLGTIRLPEPADNIGLAGPFLGIYSSRPVPRLLIYRRGPAVAP
jgi:hypothetical protein